MEQVTSTERKRLERWDRVVSTAMELAAGGGYDAVQMREVAAEAGVAIGTLYRYFGSKDELLLAGLARWAVDVCDEILSEPIPGSTAAERVVHVLRRASQPIQENPVLMSALVTAMASPAPGQPYRDETRRAVAGMVRTAIGDVDVDAEGVVRVIAHVWFSTIVAWVAGRPAYPVIADELENAARLLLDGREQGLDAAAPRRAVRAVR